MNSDPETQATKPLLNSHLVGFDIPFRVSRVRFEGGGESPGPPVMVLFSLHGDDRSLETSWLLEGAMAQPSSGL